MKYRAKKQGTVLTSVIFILAVMVALGFLAQFFSNGKKNFSVSFGSKNLNGESVVLQQNAVSMFYVKYVIKINDGYTVKIIPNAENDFDFVKNGKVMAFGSLVDVSNGFFLNIQDDYFTVFLTLDVSMQTILKKLLEADIELMNEIDMQKDYFIIVVESNKEVISIPFSIGV